MVTEDPNRTTDGTEKTGSATASQLLGEYLACGILAIDDQRRITALSAGAGKLLALTSADVLHQPLDCLPAPLRDFLLDSLCDDKPIQDRQVTLPNPAGNLLVIRVSVTLLRGANGRPTGAIAVLNNITNAGHLEQNLSKLDRLASIGMLSASMAHEIKNAMVAVKTFVDLLIKKNQDASLADIVGREMHRIDSIVSQMLRFAGPARPTLGLVHLHQIIEQSLGLVRHHLEGRRITLRSTFHAEPDTLRGDAYQLEQAFLNLFFNALDAMGAHGELSVTTEVLPAGVPDAALAPMLRVIVQDTGMGIPPENLERLFDPFFTTKPHGTGLGLPITRRIVQEHRGDLSVASEIHKGTVFTMLFPSVSSAHSAGKQP